MQHICQTCNTCKHSIKVFQQILSVINKALRKPAEETKSMQSPSKYILSKGAASKCCTLFFCLFTYFACLLPYLLTDFTHLLTYSVYVLHLHALVISCSPLNSSTASRSLLEFDKLNSVMIGNTRIKIGNSLGATSCIVLRRLENLLFAIVNFKSSGCLMQCY